jgi:hypothetical protein
LLTSSAGPDGNWPTPGSRRLSPAGLFRSILRLEGNPLATGGARLSKARQKGVLVEDMIPDSVGVAPAMILPHCPKDWRDHFSERAAAHEFDAGLRSPRGGSRSHGHLNEDQPPLVLIMCLKQHALEKLAAVCSSTCGTSSACLHQTTTTLGAVSAETISVKTFAVCEAALLPLVFYQVRHPWPTNPPLAPVSLGKDGFRAQLLLGSGPIKVLAERRIG